MPNVGPMELVVVLVIALIVLGPKRLPEVGRSLGKGIREFKDSMNNIGGDDDEVDVEEPPKQLATAAATAPAAPAAETSEAEPKP
jgi:sec-independent protein translocase protein TatA